MSEKVRTSKKTAGAIDRLKDRNPTWTIHDLFHVVVNKGYSASKENFEDVAILRKWAFTYELIFAKALLNGYEVEQTPEDKVRELYIDQKCKPTGDTMVTHLAIKDVLDILNIKIKDINA